jgi:hypothetical protein
MKLHRLLWTRPAADVLLLLRRDAQLPVPADPWPHAWPYANPMYRPTQLLPTYERTDR